MTIAIIILLLIASIAMSYSIWNLIKQNEDLEDTVIYYQTKLSNLREQVLDMEIQLKEIDIRGSFASDDEVGFVFKEIKEMSSDLTKAIESIYEFRD
jgi:competence protein ComGC